MQEADSCLAILGLGLTGLPFSDLILTHHLHGNSLARSQPTPITTAVPYIGIPHGEVWDKSQFLLFMRSEKGIDFTVLERGGYLSSTFQSLILKTHSCFSFPCGFVGGFEPPVLGQRKPWSEAESH